MHHFKLRDGFVGGGSGMEVADVATDQAELQDRLRPAPGTRSEITSDGEFYRIDINTRPRRKRRAA